MKILIAAAGSLGDTLPFVALGRALQAREHEVHLFASESYEAYAGGLPFTAVTSKEETEALLNNPDITHPRAGWKLIGETFTRSLPRAFEAMKAQVVPGRTIAVGSTFAFSVRLLKDALAVPTATVHRAPRLGPYGTLDRLPVPLQRGLWWLMDRLVLDRIFTRPFNAYRAQLGLPAVDRICDAWLHQADATLGMFPRWFAEPQPDWPARLTLTGFPLYDHGDIQPLPEAVDAFLAAGEPPVAFTAGTANAVSHHFFAASAEACAASGRRALLITKAAAQLPARLPPGVMHVPYAPFGALLPRLAAFVHHGGIGTTSQALRAGVPQIVRPMGYDQFDNAFHVQQLGVGQRILTKAYRAPAVAEALRALTDDAALQARCEAVAAQCRADGDAIAKACDAVLALRPPTQAA